MPFRAPSAVAQRSAMQFASVSGGLQPWLQPRDFPSIREPDDDDWPRGKGQTYENYLASNPQRVASTTRNPRSRKLALAQGRQKIYIMPLTKGRQDLDAFPDLDALAAGVAAFYGLEVAVLPMITLKQLEAGGTPIRTRHRGAQYHAGDINANLISKLPSDGLTLCAVTMLDVWKGDMNYLFGLAFLQAHVGCFSFHRHQPNSPDCEFFHGSLELQPGDDHVLLRRGFQTLSHELGHTFGMKHCVYFSCLMQGANSLTEAESRMPDLCPVCLRKLLWATRRESGEAVRRRYERLLAFFESRPAGFEKHLAWVRSRLGVAPPSEKATADGRTDGAEEIGEEDKDEDEDEEPEERALRRLEETSKDVADTISKIETFHEIGTKELVEAKTLRKLFAAEGVRCEPCAA